MRHLRDVLISWGPVGLLILATLENAGPPTPGGTDFVLLILAAARPKDAMLCAGLATLGSLIGSAIFFEVLRRGGEKLLVKFTSSGRGARFRDWANRYGLATVFVSALVPVPVLPFKVFVACTATMGVSRLRFLSVLAPARVLRFAALAYLGQQVGENSGAWLKSHSWYLLGLAALLGLGLWVLLRRAERIRLAKAEAERLELQ
ncbi:MAG TPA: VTT domain-containing protein [Bryobacteraceae bacterium]|jgi:membrane protein DedA with SNARE-associated domain